MTRHRRFARKGPFGQVPLRRRYYRDAPTSRRPRRRFVSFTPLYRSIRRRRDLPAFQESLVYVPCSMTSVEPTLGWMLPSAFPDGVGLDSFFTRLDHTARTLAIYASSSGHPSDARLASGCTNGLGRAGLVTRGVSVHGFSSYILHDWTWLAHQGEGRSRRLSNAQRQNGAPSPETLTRTVAVFENVSPLPKVSDTSISQSAVA